MRPPMQRAAATVEVTRTRVALDKRPNHSLARVTATVAVFTADAGLGSDTGSPQLLEGVENLVSYGPHQFDGDVRLLHRNHGAVQIIDRARGERVDLL